MHAKFLLVFSPVSYERFFLTFQSKIGDAFAQMLFKDQKIMQLNDQLLEYERKMMDAQETVDEKSEVLRSRDKAIQVRVVSSSETLSSWWLTSLFAIPAAAWRK